MSANGNRGFVVAGTDTNVGKTVFCAALVQALGGAYWKPIQAGLDGETDIETVARLSGASKARLLPEVYRFSSPCSPHRAAEVDGVIVEDERLSIPTCGDQSCGPLIVEGAGGLMVPLTRSLLQIDQFATWGLPIVLCARTQLGTINHTLLSVEAIQKRGLVLFGIVFIGDENFDTQRTIGEMSGVKILGRLPFVNPLNARSLGDAFDSTFRREDFVLPS